MPANDLATLIAEMIAAYRELDLLLFDEEVPHILGPPASEAQIANLQALLGAPLPPSYLAFLTLHNGWDKFVGGAKILAIEDQHSAWVKKRIDDLDTFFYEDQDVENPFGVGAIPIMLGRDEEGYLVLDPRQVRDDGEMDFVQFDLIDEEQRFDTFTAYLSHRLDVLREMIDEEKLGTDDES
jgi:hypothetical protein